MAEIIFKDRVVENQGRKVFTDINTGEVLMIVDEMLDEGVVCEQGVLATASNLNKLAQKEYVQEQLQTKADVAYVNAALATKVSRDEVTSLLMAQSNLSSGNNALAANIEQVPQITSMANELSLAAVASTDDYNYLADKTIVDLSNIVLKTELLELIYPVGAIKFTAENINPSIYLGGTWLLLGAGHILAENLETHADCANIESDDCNNFHIEIVCNIWKRVQ